MEHLPPPIRPAWAWRTTPMAHGSGSATPMWPNQPPPFFNSFFKKEKKKDKLIFFLGIFFEELATLQIFKTWLGCIASFFHFGGKIAIWVKHWGQKHSFPSFFLFL
jgi:hypothetical protein